MTSNIVTIVSLSFGLVGTIIGGLVAIRQSKITAKTADNQNEIATTATAITGLDLLAKQHTAELIRVNQAHIDYVAKCDIDRTNFSSQIAHQAGEISVLKTIPLTNISTTLEIIAEANKSLAQSNTKILERLQISAVQLTKDTKSAAQHVEDVKIDLEADNKTGGRS